MREKKQGTPVTIEHVLRDDSITVSSTVTSSCNVRQVTDKSLCTSLTVCGFICEHSAPLDNMHHSMDQVRGRTVERSSKSARISRNSRPPVSAQCVLMKQRQCDSRREHRAVGATRHVTTGVSLTESVSTNGHSFIHSLGEITCDGESDLCITANITANE